MCAVFLAILILLTTAPVAAAEDWLQWLGPNRDGRSSETGLLKIWPDGGPREIWRQRIGEGFSGIAIVGDRVFTSCARGEDEFALCLNAGDGAEIWKTRTGKTFASVGATARAQH